MIILSRDNNDLLLQLSWINILLTSPSLRDPGLPRGQLSPPRLEHDVGSIYFLTLATTIPLRNYSAIHQFRTMRRPGPLQEWPLEQFLPSNPKSPFKSGNKRPGVPLPFSPAKRRILDAEGISSEKTFKTPQSASSRTPLQSPVRFVDIVKGSDSSSRKFDYKNDSQTTVGSNTAVNSASSSQSSTVVSLDKTPTRATTTTLAPSPELVVKAAPVPIASSSAILLDDHLDHFITKHSPSSPRHTTIPTMIPREMPAPPDRQSIHYPGFHVLADTHIQLLCASSESVGSTNSESESRRDKEGFKENIPPRRKARKAVATPIGLSPAEKAKLMDKTPGTPISHHAEAPLSPTPRRRTNSSMYDLTTPSRSIPTPTERLLRRRLMEDEADEAGGDDTSS